MDFRKAFDSVPHEVILLKLAKSGADAATCRLVRTFLKDHTAILGMDIEEIKILCGVLQGGILSPLFFDLFIDDLPNKELGEEHGMLLGLLIIAFLLYADDTILISGSAEGLQGLLTPSYHWALENGMDFHPGKCSVMVLGGNRPPTRKRPNFYLDPEKPETKIAYVKHSVYLGVELSSRTHIQRGAGEVRKMVQNLAPLMNGR